MTDDTTRPLRTELGLDEADDDRHPDDPTAAPAAQPAPPATAPDDARASHDGPAWPLEPVYRSGPAPFALLLGILGLVTAAAVLVSEVTDLSIPWNDLGPWTVVGGGALVVLVGLIGLRGSRTQD